uniref:acid phosphatase n=1 Tax=Panagrolaimus davidi TaxID=227884 RepID=A0A914QSW0_9BILA
MYFILVLINFVPVIFCEDRLLHVHALWRHGERNPRDLFKGDLNNASAFPDGIGQLTKYGIHQLYTLGEHFQARYIYEYKFLSSNYSNTEVYSRSTALDRAFVSAMAFFSGLYSDGTSQEEHILSPISIHTIPLEDDFLYIIGFQCQRKEEIRNIAENSYEMQTLYNRFNDLLVEVANNTESSLEFDSALNVYDTAVLEEMYGLPLPDWVSARIPEWNEFRIKYVLIMYGYVSFTNSPFNLQLELLKITGGSLVAEIVDRMIHKIKCERFQTPECLNIKYQKLYTYSGHDITLIGLISGLGFKTFMFETEEMPSVSSSVVLELWENEKIRNSIISQKTFYNYYYVKIYYYQNSSVENPKYIGDLIPECQGQKGCPISYLIKRAELLRPKPDLKIFHPCLFQFFFIM